MQMLSQTAADRAHRWGKIPNVRPLDGRGHNKKGRGVVVASIGVVAKPPTRARSNDSVGAFIGIQSKCSKRISLCPPDDIRQAELRPTQGIKRDGHRDIMVLH